MFEIGNSLREARVRQQLELGEVELATKIRVALPAGARGGELRRASGPDLRQGLPAHLRGLSRARRPALRRRVQLSLRRRRRGARVSRSSRGGRRTSRSSTVAWSGAGSRSRSAGIALLVVFVIAAWKFGGNGNEQIPNLGTTTAAQTKKVLPAGDADAACRDEAALVPALRARGQRQLLDGCAQLVVERQEPLHRAPSSPASRSASSRAGSGSTSATRGTWRWSTTATSSTSAAPARTSFTPHGFSRAA